MVDKFVRQLQASLEERKVTLSLTEGARRDLARRGYDPVFGARPLKRAIQRWIENPLAQDILSGRFMPGSTITADVENDEFIFTSKEA